ARTGGLQRRAGRRAEGRRRPGIQRDPDVREARARSAAVVGGRAVIPGLFNDPTAKAMRTALDGLQQREQSIANNIANVDTPNYKAKEVRFEDMLAQQLADP